MLKLEKPLASSVTNLDNESVVVEEVVEKTVEKLPPVVAVEKLSVNFIVTCFDREGYWPYLKNILNDYKIIKANYVLCYSGTQKSFETDVRINNPGHESGDFQLTKLGYDLLKRNGVSRFVKICVDSWLLDEAKIIEIFYRMILHDSPFAGNYWYNNTPGSLSTDIIFADLSIADVFDLWRLEHDCEAEVAMNDAVNRTGKNPYIIPERVPVHWQNRWECRTLGWTMQHNLQDNLNFFKHYTSGRRKG